MTSDEILPMPQIAYSLIRYSEPQQRKGDSRRRQNDFATRWCAENNARLDEDLSMLLDGQSAFRGRHCRKGLRDRKLRPLAQFLDDIKTGRVTPGSILIMENIDRLSREEIDEAWELFRSILRAGVDVVTERPERRYTRKSLSNFAEVLEVKFAMYLAHEESVKKSERVGKTWREKKRRAAEDGAPVSHACPAWIRLGPEGYELIPERAAIIRRILELTGSMGAQRIARRFQTEGVPCFGRKGRWLPEYIRHILRSPQLYGAYPKRTTDAEGRIVPEGEPVPEYYPPVCTRQEALAALAAVRGRRETSGRPGEGEANLFTGILYAAGSKARFQLKPIWMYGRRYEYLSSAPAGGVRIPYRPVEQWLVRCLDDLRAEDVLPGDRQAGTQLRRIEELTAEVLALGDRIKTLEAQQIDPETDADLLPSVQTGIIEARRRQRERTKELRALEEEASTSRTKTLGACRSALSLLDTPERRRIAKGRIRQLVEAIWLRVQRVNRCCRIVHAQIYLRGVSRPLYRQLVPADLPDGTEPWDLAAADFRRGDIGDVTGGARDAHREDAR